MFVINDCYWRIGGDDTRVWSSARNGYVPITDAEYTAWLEHDYVRPMLTEEELANVLKGQGWHDEPNFGPVRK
jgi:hypothetical protein